MFATHAFHFSEYLVLRSLSLVNFNFQNPDAGFLEIDIFSNHMTFKGENICSIVSTNSRLFEMQAID